MPRSGTGTYTLPSGNPVVTGTTIESTWANTTLSDIATTLSDSLSRSGQGGMTAALRIADGTQGAPGVGFANETGSGFYRAGTGEVWAVVQGAQTLNLDASGVTVPSDKATSIEGTFVFNETGADKDARFEGDTDANLLFVDASTDRVGIGTSSPGEKLAVNQGNFYALRTGGAKLRLADQNNEVSVESSPTGAVSNMIFKTSATTQMTLDSSGNLGLGVTPSAWLGAGYIDFPGNGYVGNAASYSGNTLSTGLNAYYATGAWRYKASSFAATRFDHSNGSFGWYTAPSGTAGNAISFTQAMTLDASGQLSVGAVLAENSTGVYLLPTGEMRVKDSTENGTSQISIYNTNTTNDSEQFFVAMNSADVDIGNKRTDGGALKLFTNNTERARITSGGDLLVGGTAQVTSELFLLEKANGVNHLERVWNKSTTGDNGFIVFSTEATATDRGGITYNRAGGLVAYNTTSDYRAKDIIGPVQDPGATIDALKVYEGVMKGATQSRPMLIAHEAQAHAPYAVSGVKDEVNEDGTPKLQQMDVSSLVPLLLAEIQSLRARVAALEAA